MNCLPSLDAIHSALPAPGPASAGRGRRDLMREESDGTLVLEPATVVTELERRFLANAAGPIQYVAASSHSAARDRGPAQPPAPGMNVIAQLCEEMPGSY